MERNEFLQAATLESIKLLRSGGWTDTSYNRQGAKLVYDFASKLTDLVYGDKTE